MNISKIIKNIRYMKIVIDHLFMTPELKYEVKHSHQNIIDVDFSENEQILIKKSVNLYINHFNIMIKFLKIH